jgi:hypothetical protein
MTSTVENRIAIHELIALHGHLMDEGNFDRLPELVTEDIEYDVTMMGGGILRGPTEIADAAKQLGEHNPLGHHVTNVVIDTLSTTTATCRSKGIGIMSNGTIGTVVYEDELTLTPDGWRLSKRQVLPRLHPLQPSGTTNAPK